MIEYLGSEQLKTGETLVISHSDNLGLNPGYTFFLREMADLMDNGHALKVTVWSDQNCGILYGEINSKVVAILAYDKKEITYQLLNILLTAVDKDHRRKGIHTIMNRYFEETTLKLGATRISATVHHANEARLKSAEKDGLRFVYKKLYKKLI